MTDNSYPDGGSIVTRIKRFFVDTPNLIGIVCVIGSVSIFSGQDMMIKFLSGGYPLHQIVLTRSVIAIIIVLAIFVPLEGGYRILKTKHLPLHLLRGMAVVMANITFFLGLASLSIADATAVFFVAPLLITILSVPLLGEKVGIRRLMAVLVGLLGVGVILQPGTDSFQAALLLPLVSACFYASLNIMTRKIGVADKASTMTFYIQVTFITVSATFGLIAGDGRFADGSSPQIDFLFRAWIVPVLPDALMMLGIGCCNAVGNYLISQGYRIAQAGAAAPFEYTAMPSAVFWSIVIFGQWPGVSTWTGIALICSAGLYVFYRETIKGRAVATAKPLRRNK